MGHIIDEDCYCEGCGVLHGCICNTEKIQEKELEEEGNFLIVQINDKYYHGDKDFTVAIEEIKKEAKQEGYEEGFEKGRIAKVYQKCPHCNKIVKLKIKEKALG